MSHSLAHWVAPLTPERFVTEYWNQRALLVRGAPSTHAGLLDRDGLRQALFAAASRVGRDRVDNFHVRATHRTSEGVQLHHKLQAHELDTWLAQGTTLCVNNLDAGSDALLDLATAFKRELGVVANPQFACYWSTDNEGFDLHFDDRHAFTLQLEGEKTWQYSATRSLSEPRSGGSAIAGRLLYEGLLPDETPPPLPDVLEEVTLRAGDVFYLPVGTWHAAKASSHSLALNLGTPLFTFVDLLKPLLRTLQREPQRPASHLDEAREDLRQAFARVTRGALDRTWVSGVRASPTRRRKGEHPPIGTPAPAPKEALQLAFEVLWPTLRARATRGAFWNQSLPPHVGATLDPTWTAAPSSALARFFDERFARLGELRALLD